MSLLLGILWLFCSVVFPKEKIVSVANITALVGAGEFLQVTIYLKKQIKALIIFSHFLIIASSGRGP